MKFILKKMKNKKIEQPLLFVVYLLIAKKKITVTGKLMEQFQKNYRKKGIWL